jgi:hypothetical protein
MHIERVSPELIERYLDRHSLRFYRSRDGKGFLVLFSTEHSKLHVDLRINGEPGDVLVISVQPAAHHSAVERARLMELVNDWNRDTHWPKAYVRETSKPSRVGVVGESTLLLAEGIHFEALASFITITIRSAMKLFDRINQTISLPSARTLEQWLNCTA